MLGLLMQLSASVEVRNRISGSHCLMSWCGNRPNQIKVYNERDDVILLQLQKQLVLVHLVFDPRGFVPWANLSTKDATWEDPQLLH